MVIWIYLKPLSDFPVIWNCIASLTGADCPSCAMGVAWCNAPKFKNAEFFKKPQKFRETHLPNQIFLWTDVEGGAGEHVVHFQALILQNLESVWTES